MEIHQQKIMIIYQLSWHCNIDRFLNKRTLSLLWLHSIFFTNIKYGIKLKMRDLLSDVVLNKPPLNYENTYVILFTVCLVLERFDFTYYLQPNLLFFYVLFNQEERERLWKTGRKFQDPDWKSTRSFPRSRCCLSRKPNTVGLFPSYCRIRLNSCVSCISEQTHHLFSV